MSNGDPSTPVGRGRGRAVGRAASPGQPALSPGHTPLQQNVTPALGEIGRRASVGRRAEIGAECAPSNGKKMQDSPPDSPGHVKQENLEVVHFAKKPNEDGSKGRKYRIFANHFELHCTKLLQVTHYHVEIKSTMKLTRDENRPIFWKCLMQNGPALRINSDDMFQIAYDGVSGCYTLKEFSISTESPSEFEVEVLLPKRDRPMKFTVLLQRVGLVLVDLNLPSSPTNGAALTPVQIIDIILRQFRSNPHLPTSDLFYPFKSSVFMTPSTGNGGPGAIDLGAGREVWRGLFTSTHMVGNGKAFVNMDVAHSVFYKNRIFGTVDHYPVIHFVCDVLNDHIQHGPTRRYLPSAINVDTSLNDLEKRIFEREIKGLKVGLDYRRPNQGNPDRVYKVLSLDEPACRIFFETREGARVSVAQYFEATYGDICGPLKAPNMPTLKVGQKNRFIHLPIEHCFLSKNQKYTKKLSDMHVATMIKQTCMQPKDRKTSIEKMVQQARFTEDPYLKNFGIELSPEMVKIDARVLPVPQVAYQNNSVAGVRDGVWRMQPNQKFHLPASFENMAAISFGQPPSNAQKTFRQFVYNLLQVCFEFGMQVPNPQHVFMYVEEDSTARRVENAFSVLAQESTSRGKNFDLILVMVQKKGMPLYGEVKRMAEINRGQMTQCCTFKTVTNTSRDTVANLAFKINMKMGGINCYVKSQEEAAQKLFGDVETLVLGIDVTHPGPLETRMCSIASVVGSMDLQQMRYGVSIKVQKQRKEQIVYVSALVQERLMAFFKETKVKPKRIIVYRDGVSDGEFREVLREELLGVHNACATIDRDYKPPVTFVVVQKRHHTRLFPGDANDSCGRAQNVHPGTTVDHLITDPKFFHFYLCSHAGIQGTSRPTRYCVLHDDNGFSQDDLQLISYYLCHCFSRCTRSVSIPAPVYYADLACTRARTHVAAALGDSFSDSASSNSGEGRGSTMSDQEYIAATTVRDPINRTMYFT